MQKPTSLSEKWWRSKTTCRLLKQRKQSKTINQSRKVLDPWFMVKMIIGTFVPIISPQVKNWASLINSSIESSPELRNSCSNVSTIKISDLLKIVNNTSSMSDDVYKNGEFIFALQKFIQLRLAVDRVKPWFAHFVYPMSLILMSPWSTWTRTRAWKFKRRLNSLKKIQSLNCQVLRSKVPPAPRTATLMRNEYNTNFMEAKFELDWRSTMSF